MIEDSPILTLQRHFKRPLADALHALRNTPTGFVVDCMDGRGALHHDIKPLLAMAQPLVGVAVTCECGPSDNLGVFGALDIAQQGDVIVASTDSFMGAAVIGGLVLQMMKNKGVAGFITDGLVRDLDGVGRVALPVFCKGVPPNSPSKGGPAKAGGAINLDSVHIKSGDVIVADRDGVVVVPYEHVDSVCQKLVVVKKAEQELLDAVDKGLITPSFYTELVESGKIVEVNQ